MDRQPVLESEHLLLRPLRPDDWDALYAVASDPLVWQLHPAKDRWQESVFRTFFDDALAQGGALIAIDKHVLSYAEGASGATIGSSRMQAYDPADGGSVEIGWTFLARSHWGGETNREMKRLMLAHCFRYVARVDFRIGETNLRSRRAMEKIGGRLTDRTDMLGPTPHVVYEITRESFAAGPLAG